MSAKNVENLWAVGVPPQTPLGSSQRSSKPLANGAGLAAPKSPTPLSDFGLDFPIFDLAPQ